MHYLVPMTLWRSRNLGYFGIIFQQHGSWTRPLDYDLLRPENIAPRSEQPVDLGFGGFLGHSLINRHNPMDDWMLMVISWIWLKEMAKQGDSEQQAQGKWLGLRNGNKNLCCSCKVMQDFKSLLQKVRLTMKNKWSEQNVLNQMFRSSFCLIPIPVGSLMQNLENGSAMHWRVYGWMLQDSLAWNMGLQCLELEDPRLYS